MPRVRTNKVLFSVDHVSFDAQYDIFKISTSDKYIASGAGILDCNELDNQIKAVKYTSGKEVLVLMYAKANSFHSIKSIVKGCKEAKSLSVQKVSSSTVSDNDLLQLMLNSLGSSDSKLLAFNNLSGHLYYFNNDWIKKSKTGVRQIKTLDVRVSNLKLAMNVVTFTNISEKKWMNPFTKKRPFESYPQYVISSKRTLRRKLDSDSSEAFIIRQFRNSKNEIPFMDLRNYNAFKSSKMGVLDELVKCFNEKYAGIGSIDFETVEECQSIDTTSYEKKAYDNSINAYLAQCPIRVIDCISDEYSKRFTSEVIETIHNLYPKADVKEGKRISKDKLNIRLIHEKEKYDEGKDAYKASSDSSVQHITFEDFKVDSKSAVKNIIKEAIIKKDLVEKKLSLFDWASFNPSSDYDFVLRQAKEDGNDYAAMTIHQDGSFEVERIEPNLFTSDKLMMLSDIFENEYPNTIGVIMNQTDNVLVINDTGSFTIPELSEIEAQLRADKKKSLSRTKDNKKELLNSVTDIKTFHIDGNLNYCVGTVGYGMNTGIATGSLIREVVPYKGQIRFEELLPLMDVMFVRNGQLTVMPFPFKYLREYLNNQMS